MRLIKSSLLALAFLALGPAALAGAADCQSVYSAAAQAGDPAVFSFCFFNQGETDLNGNVSTRNWTAPEKAAFARAAQYWADVLFPSGSAPEQTARLTVFMEDTPNNASAYSDWPSGGAGTEVAEALLNPGYTPTGNYEGEVNLGLYLKPDFGPLGQMYGAPYNVENTFIHELGHALGIIANPGVICPTDPNTHECVGPYVINSSYNTNDSKFGNMVKGEGSAGIAGSPTWYYAGSASVTVVDQDGQLSADPNSAAIKVFNDERLKTVTNYYGIPMANASDQARSHFGLRNTEMTHKLFRNYATFVEAELAVMKDLGYGVKLRDHFGVSIYTNGNYYTVSNGKDYSLGFDSNWNGGDDFTGAYDGAGANMKDYALGVHVYGAENELDITTLAIRADGYGAGGVRVDGWRNEINIKTEVTANGQGGTGLLVAYGNGHKIALAGGASLSAAQGDAVRFDIGVNGVDVGQINADGYGGHALYSYYRNPYDATDIANYPILGEFAEHETYLGHGALVEKFDVAGTITGGRSAIYISPNSHVKEINVKTGAVINGAIISDYDDQWGAAAAAGVNDISTKLNIEGGADKAHAFTVNGAILGYGAQPGLGRFYEGRGLIDLKLTDANKFTHFTPESRVKVHNFTVAGGAELLVTPTLGLDYGTVIGSNNFDLQNDSLVGFQTNIFSGGGGGGDTPLQTRPAPGAAGPEGLV